MARFVTIAAFGELPKAEIARGVLIDGGIRAYITDGEIVAMDWLIANAVGGVKVQVAEEDVPRALELLAEAKEVGDGMVSDEVDEEELARQAMAAEREEGAEGEATPPEEDEPPPAAPAPAVTPLDPEERERNAKRAFMLSLLALLFPPLSVVSLYFLVAGTFGQGPLSRRGKVGLVLTAAMTLPIAYITAMMLRWIMAAGKMMAD